MSHSANIPDSSIRLHPAIPPVLPGVGLCLLITGAAYAIESFEVMLLGKAWLESLVLAILLGTAVRTILKPSKFWRPGIAFSAKYLLEIAVVLLGVSVSTAMVAAAGPQLLIAIAAVVIASILISVTVGKLLRLPTRMALLIACGNAICGNSAIAAVAPVIGADEDDIAASIAFTAVLGVLVVLGLPIFGIAIGLSGATYGVFAGLTVYAVPQVIAAAAPLGAAAIQMGTLVKLVRVLMLGPVCLILSFIAPRLGASDEPKDNVFTPRQSQQHPSIFRMVPWFIVGFLVMVSVRSMGFIPEMFVAPVGEVATLLTVISMAALGLGVDVRVVSKAGARVTTAVLLSLLSLGLISLSVIWYLGV